MVSKGVSGDTGALRCGKFIDTHELDEFNLISRRSSASSAASRSLDAQSGAASRHVESIGSAIAAQRCITANSNLVLVVLQLWIL